jgi:transposase-like protein
MKKKITFSKRLRLAFTVFNSSKNLIIVSCNNCNSFDLEFNVLDDRPEFYYSKYKCLKCGSECDNREYWFERVIK